MKVAVSADTVALLTRTVMALQGDSPAPAKKSLPRWLPNGEPITTLKQLSAVLCIDEKTAAYVVLESHNPCDVLYREAKRRVRTPEGALRYGQPIGETIVRDRRSWRPRIMAAALAGGMTLSFLTGAEPSTGYVVAERGNNQEIPDDVFFDKARGMSVLREWVVAHKKKFDDPSAHLGIWHDTQHHEVVLDVSYVVEDREDAINLGVANNQQAIWDVANMAEIDTGGTGDRQEKGNGNGQAGQRIYREATQADQQNVRSRDGFLAGTNLGSDGQDAKRPMKVRLKRAQTPYYQH